jgi:hypothetical protein
MKIRVSPDEVMRQFAKLEHEEFQEAIPTHWTVYKDGHVKAQSVLWLFCWAKTGMNSLEAAETAEEIFDAIMDKPFNYCDARIPHDDFARKYRYSEDDQYVENNLAVRLSEKPYQIT